MKTAKPLVVVIIFSTEEVQSKPPPPKLEKPKIDDILREISEESL